MNILHIMTSPLGDHSVTRALGKKLIQTLQQKYSDAKITERDLALQLIPHLDLATLGAFQTPEDQLTPELSALLKNSNEIISEVMVANILLIEAPMYNFGIPSALKAWVDHLVRAGKTFKYSENGPVGLVPGGKKVYIVSARGGIYSQGPAQSMDHQESYLRAVLGFLGISDVDVIRAEGVNMGPDHSQKAKDEAMKKISDLAA